RQRAEANEQKANAQRDEVKAVNDQLQRTLYASNMNLAKNAWDQHAVSRVLGLLDQHRPKPGEPDLRGFEWYFLNAALSFKGVPALARSGTHATATPWPLRAGASRRPGDAPPAGTRDAGPAEGEKARRGRPGRARSCRCCHSCQTRKLY